MRTEAAAEPVEQRSIYGQIKKLVQRKGGGPIAAKTINGIEYTFTGSPFDEPHDDAEALGYVAVRMRDERKSLVDIGRVSVYMAPWDSPASIGFEVNTVDDNTRNQFTCREIVIKNPQSMAHVLDEVIKYVAQHIHPKHEVTAATEEPESSDAFVNLHRYLHTRRTGKLSVPGYSKPFDFATERGLAFLRWDDQPVVSFSVYDDTGSGSPKQAAICLGLYPASTPGKHIEHVEDLTRTTYSKTRQPAVTVLTLLRHALDKFNVQDYRPLPKSIQAAAEPKKPSAHLPVDPKAPAHFKAFVGLRDLVGKVVSKPGFPWRIKIESAWHDPRTEVQYAHPQSASCKLLVKGKTDETIVVNTHNFGRSYDVRVNTDHLGNNGKTGLVLQGTKLATVTKPAEFLWTVLSALGLGDPKNDEIPVKSVYVPSWYLDRAVKGYLGAVLNYTTDDGHEDYNADTGDGPNLDENASIGDFDAESVAAARDRMSRFLSQVYDRLEDEDGIEAEEVGSTAYLSHTGTGVNFKDRRIDEDLAEDLDRIVDVIFPGDLEVTAVRDGDGYVTDVHIRF